MRGAMGPQPVGWANRRAERREHPENLCPESGTLWEPQDHGGLTPNGEPIAQKTVVRLMREAGLRSRVVRKYKATTHSRSAHPVVETVLNRQLVAERPTYTRKATGTLGSSCPPGPCRAPMPRPIADTTSLDQLVVEWQLLAQHAPSDAGGDEGTCNDK